MPRRPEPPELTTAREQLRARYERQQAAAVAFFDAAARLAKLRAEAEAVEAGLRRHAATLTDALGVDAAAQVTVWSRAQLAEAQRQRRARRATATATHAEEAAQQEASVAS